MMDLALATSTLSGNPTETSEVGRAIPEAEFCCTVAERISKQLDFLFGVVCPTSYQAGCDKQDWASPATEA
jgi:hypothetical protein